MIYVGDCLDMLNALDDDSVDAMITDPPAGIGFMSSSISWDKDRGGRDKWIAWLSERLEEAYRVLKPGAHILVWALPRTSHWTGTAIEDAGFEVRDRLGHFFGTGFPKSANISKQIDKAGVKAAPKGGWEAFATELRRSRKGAGVSRKDLAEWFPEYSAVTANWERVDAGFRVPTLEIYKELIERLGMADTWLEAVRAGDKRKAKQGGKDRRNDNTVYGLGHEGVQYEATTVYADRWKGWATALKPAEESWFLCQKSVVNNAGEVSALSLRASNEVLSDFARELVDLMRGPLFVEAREGTAISNSPGTASTPLNTVSLWNSILVGLYRLQNMFTTKTATALITELRTLKFLLSGITPESITKALTNPNELTSLVRDADRRFHALDQFLRGILTLSAQGDVIRLVDSHRLLDDLLQRGETEILPLEPLSEDWWLARKPFKGAAYRNVLKHGTGALNIDASRIGTNDAWKPSTRGASDSIGTFKTSTRTTEQHAQGRWPAHITFSHNHDCVPNGTKVEKGHKGYPKGPGGKSVHWGEGTKRSEDCRTEAWEGIPDQEVQAWVCSDGCPVGELDMQSGVTTSGNRTSPRRKGGDGTDFGRLNDDGWKPKGCDIVDYGDKGGVSRFFKTFEGTTRFLYQSKPAKKEKNAGLDGEIVVVEALWENEVRKVRLLVDTEQSPPRVTAVFGLPSKNVIEWSMFLFGSRTTDPSLKGCKYTISTTTNSTIGSTTWNFLTPLLTSGSTEDVFCGTGCGKNLVENAEMSTLWINITSEKMESLLGVNPAASRTLIKIIVSDSKANENSPGRYGNFHATVKSTKLMAYLINLITPPGGTILDPFAGSGSTGVACIQEGFEFIGIEQSEEYAEVAEKRIEHARKQMSIAEVREEKKRRNE